MLHPSVHRWVTLGALIAGTSVTAVLLSILPGGDFAAQVVPAMPAVSDCSLEANAKFPTLIWGGGPGSQMIIPIKDPSKCWDVCVLENEDGYVDDGDPAMDCITRTKPNKVLDGAGFSVDRSENDGRIWMGTYSGTRPGWRQLRLDGEWYAIEVFRKTDGNEEGGYCSDEGPDSDACSRVMSRDECTFLAGEDFRHYPVAYGGAGRDVGSPSDMENEYAVQARCKWDIDQTTEFPCCVPRDGANPAKFDQLAYVDCPGISFSGPLDPLTEDKYLAANCFMGAFDDAPAPVIPLGDFKRRLSVTMGVGDYDLCCNPQKDDAAGSPNFTSGPNVGRCSLSVAQNLTDYNAGKLWPKITANGDVGKPPDGKKPIGLIFSVLEKGNSDFEIETNAYTIEYLERAVREAPGVVVRGISNSRRKGSETKNVIHIDIPNPDTLSFLFRLLADEKSAPTTVGDYRNDLRKFVDLVETDNKWTLTERVGVRAAFDGVDIVKKIIDEKVKPLLPGDSVITTPAPPAGVVGRTVYEISKKPTDANRAIVLQHLIDVLKINPADIAAKDDRSIKNSCGPETGPAFVFTELKKDNYEMAKVQTHIDECADKCGMVFCVFIKSGASGVISPECVRGKLQIPGDVLNQQAACFNGGANAGAPAAGNPPAGAPNPANAPGAGNNAANNGAAAQAAGLKVGNALMPPYCARPQNLPQAPAASADPQTLNQYVAAINALGVRVWGVRKFDKEYKTLQECKQDTANPCAVVVRRDQTGGTRNNLGGGPLLGPTNMGGLNQGGLNQGGNLGGNLGGNGTPTFSPTPTPPPPGTTTTNRSNTVPPSTNVVNPPGTGTNRPPVDGTNLPPPPTRSSARAISVPGGTSSRSSSSSRISSSSSSRISSISSSRQSSVSSSRMSSVSSSRMSSVSSSRISSVSSSRASSERSSSSSRGSSSSFASGSSSSRSSGSSSSNSSRSSSSSSFFTFSFPSFSSARFSSGRFSSFGTFFSTPVTPPPGTPASSRPGGAFSSFGAFFSNPPTASRASSRPGFAFSSFGFIVPPPVTQLSSSSACPANICFPCSSNDQCPSHQCVNGMCAPVCGNSVVDASEACDDGNSSNVDACSNSCKLGTDQPCRVHDQCQTGLCINERCAPCNANNDCPADRICLSRECVTAPMCGNAIPEWTEKCDDGDQDDWNACSNRCRRGNGEACTVNRDCASLFCLAGICTACSTNDQCGGARCIDGRCEDLCGNGVVNPGEQCDSGAQNSDITPDACRADCLLPRVGDGVKDSNEECDDGNTVSGDGCDRYGRIEQSRSRSPLVIDLTNPGNQSPLVGSVTGKPPRNTDVGPAALTVMITGAAAGFAWMRRRKR